MKKKNTFSIALILPLAFLCLKATAKKKDASYQEMLNQITYGDQQPAPTEIPHITFDPFDAAIQVIDEQSKKENEYQAALSASRSAKTEANAQTPPEKNELDATISQLAQQGTQTQKPAQRKSTALSEGKVNEALIYQTKIKELESKLHDKALAAEKDTAALTAEITELHKQIAELEQKNALASQKQQEVERLQHELIKVQNTVITIADEARIANAQLHATKIENSTMSEENSAMQQLNESLQQEVASLKQQVAAYAGDSEQKISISLQTRERLNQTREQLQTLISNLQELKNLYQNPEENQGNQTQATV